MAQERKKSLTESFFTQKGPCVIFACNAKSCRNNTPSRVIKKPLLKNGFLDLSPLIGTKRLPTKQTVHS